MTCSNKIASTPDFNTHRADITAVDGAAILTEHGNGVRCEFDEVVANLLCVGPGGSATFEVKFWSEIAGQFVSDGPPFSYVVSAAASPGNGMAISFPAKGRTFLVSITAITAGNTASAEVAGYRVPRND